MSTHGVPGSVIGKYRVVGELGRGATGIVYKAVDDTLGREVALKVLNPAVADPEILKRFRSEASILARLSHPGIACIYELFRANAELFMVMELVHGETLENLSRRVGPLPPVRAAYLVDQILAALEHAHRAGVVHRDMKPANVMVTTIGGIKIMDFGVARARGAEHVTLDGYLVGTPSYMSPEQVLGQHVDERADLYSVGVVFYRLLTGALPFAADTPVGMLQQHVSEPPAPLRSHRNDLPDWCDAIVDRALAKSPEDRFQDARAFRETLARETGSLPSIDLANAFSVPETPDDAGHVVPLAAAPHATVPMGTIAIAARPPVADALMLALRQKDRARATSILIVFGAIVASLVAVPLHVAKPARLVAAAAPIEPMPDNVFDTRILTGKGQPRERTARLVLSDAALTVTAGDEKRLTLHSVPYASVVSISYSRGQYPMWNSPKGPAPVARAQDAARRAPRHWIAVRTNTDTRFVVLRFDDAHIKDVLWALQERTGHAPQIVGKRRG